MEFRDLKAQYKRLEKEMAAAVSPVLQNCNFISGNQVGELEEELAAYVGRKYCITCGNGTDALTMVMMAWDIKEGDAVFVPDFTFFASAEVVAFEGATPVFYDVREDTFNADTESLERAIQAVQSEGRLNPRAIIAVDLFGQPADYISLEEIARKYGLLLLEDGAQGFGGKIGNRWACSFGHAATTSFFPAKPLGCYGDGGAIFTDCKETAEYLRSIRVHGKGTHKYDNVRIGWNSRLDTIQAAVLQVKLKAFKEYELSDVNKAAGKYNKLLKDIVKIPSIPEGYYSSWAQYTIQLPSEEIRNELQTFLKEQGIPSMIYYPKVMSSQKAFGEVKMYENCSVAEKLSRCVLSLPIHPYLQDTEIEYVAEKIREFILNMNLHEE